jgi:hypothetical protein
MIYPLLALLVAAPDAGTDELRILRGAERLVATRGRLRVEGCDGILRLHLPPGSFDRVKRLRLVPWTDALEGADFMAGTESVSLKETARVKTFGRSRLDLAFPESARPSRPRRDIISSTATVERARRGEDPGKPPCETPSPPSSSSPCFSLRPPRRRRPPAGSVVKPYLLPLTELAKLFTAERSFVTLPLALRRS